MSVTIAICSSVPGTTTRQQHDTQLGEGRDVADIAHEPGCEWPDDDAGRDVAQDRRLTQAHRDGAGDQRECQRDADVEDEMELLGQLDGGQELAQVDGHVPIFADHRGVVTETRGRRTARR
jgi:hypothetical protein